MINKDKNFYSIRGKLRGYNLGGDPFELCGESVFCPYCLHWWDPKASPFKLLRWTSVEAARG